ncbi:MAG: DJ-1/PfpI family protein [Deltaproteobacteria bacterium]|nr:DJ-1/PfpI family protein [Deltaproteobacteria bacterium]
MKKVLIPLAQGFEEIEALAVVDILRRAGVEVIMAGTAENPIEGRNRIKVLADASLESVKGQDFDMIVLPGGAVGTENLKKDVRVKEIVERLYKKGRFITAICAAPTVLSAIGITAGRTVTSHPTVRIKLEKEKISDERVVIDGNIITSQGPGTAIEFAFKLVEILLGKEKVSEVNKGVLARI